MNVVKMVSHDCDLPKMGNVISKWTGVLEARWGFAYESVRQIPW
jgi:hypothetical protein